MRKTTMRLDKLTVKAQEALQAAQALASEHGHQSIEPEHLLHALVAQKDGVVAPILGKLGVRADTLASQVDAALTRRSVRLTRRDLERLVTTVRASNFYFMAPDYAFEVSHASALVLRISLDGRYHEVTVYAPDKLKHDPEVAAFLRIWNDLVTLVPPPNPGQRTE